MSWLGIVLVAILVFNVSFVLGLMLMGAGDDYSAGEPW